MENKNVLLAIVLSVGFLFFWSFVVMPRFTPKPVPGAAPVVAQTGSAGAMSGGPAEITAAHPEDSPAAAKDQIFRDPQNEIVLSSRGGSIAHWRLMMKGQE